MIKRNKVYTSSKYIQVPTNIQTIQKCAHSNFDFRRRWTSKLLLPDPWRTQLPSLLIVKVKMAKCNALVGEMPLKDFSMFATSLLKSDYKVEDKNIIFTTANAM